MFNWTMRLLIFALLAGALGVTGLAGGADQIAWILFVLFFVGSVMSLLTGSRKEATKDV